MTTNQNSVPQLVDHLFRREAGKMVSMLTRYFGTGNLELAEDVVQDSLMEALEHWQYRGVPDNPSAWLFRVAKNKALNLANREQYKLDYVAESAYLFQPLSGDMAELMSENEIPDDQLRMIFTCCHPAISPDSQIALALKTLCGFSIPEIARAFMTTEENINKRLVRARQSIREANIPFEIPHEHALADRLNTVLETIYLLFNEGYSASKGDDIIRYELCEEAIRLSQIILAEASIKNKENVHALAALMFLNASRFKARQDLDGNLLTLAEQDRRLWDRQMMNIGLSHLTQAAQNSAISVYHIMATISAQYSLAPSFDETDWNSILTLYDSLILLDNSPIVLLNRAVVLSQVESAASGLAELKKIEESPALKSYHLFYSTMAEFYIRQGNFTQAIEALEKAVRYAPLKPEQDLLRKKIAQCRENSPT